MHFSSKSTGMAQRDGVGREEGGGFRMESTCIPVVDSFFRNDWLDLLADKEL